MRKKIFADTGILLISQLISKSAAFFYTVFLAENLGVETFGLYTFAFSVFALISSISEFGISRYLIREVATEIKNPGLLLSQITFIRITFAIISICSFYLIGTIFNIGLEKVNITLLLLLGTIPQAIALTMDSLFIGLRKVIYSAVGLFSASISATFIGIFLLTSGYGIIGAISAMVISQLIYATILIVLFSRQNFRLVFKLDLDLVKKSLSGSLIYGLLGVLGLLYFRIDAILLSLIKGDYDTGLYGASYRFLEAILFIPSAVNAVSFPIFAKLHTQNPAGLKAFYYKSLKIMVLLSFIITISYLFILPAVINIFLPSYLPAIISIQILALTIPFMFAHVPAVLLLTSSDSYLKPVLYFSLITLSANIILNLLLIPEFGYVGSSIVTVFSEAISFIIFFVFLQLKVFKK